MIALDLPTRVVPDRISMSGFEGWLPPNTRRTFAELEGPGCIRHIWITISRSEMSNRKCLLRWYFDDGDVPHVEAPLGDFFGVMHGRDWYPLNTEYLSVQAETGYNCFFPMPFSKNARMEIESSDEGLPIYLTIDWHRYPDQELKETKRFCARWRRECPAPRYGRDFLVLDAEGPGQLLGFIYGVRLLDDTDRWSHGGGDNIYGDGETDSPFYLRGTGGEDVFGTSYGGAKHPPETHLHTGMPYYVHEDVGEARVAQRLVGYRFFEPDTVPFERSLHFRFGCMANDISSMSYWYQEKTPPRPFFRVPDFSQLLPGVTLKSEDCDLPLPDRGAWWLCGPFAENGEDEFLNTLPAETTALNPEDTFDGGHPENSHYLQARAVELGRDKARWVQTPSLRGFVDFNHYFRCAARGVTVTEPAIAIARAELDAPEEGPAQITLSWDDQALLRLNGEVFNLGYHRHFRSRTLSINLKEGANEIVIKLSNRYGTNNGGWAFAFRCVLPDSSELLPQPSSQK